MEERPSSGSGERRRDAQGTRRLLLDAAAKLFAERGYEAATVRDIAALAGVNQALLFRYFGSKQALLTEVMASGGQEQVRTTAPERLFATALRGMLTGGGKEAADLPLAVYLRSIGTGGEVGDMVKALGDEYSAVLSTLSGAEDSLLRADLAMAWLLGIGLMRVVVAKEPLAGAAPEEISRLVLGALESLLEDLAPAED
ncbi:TetR family transcriptional regulator [Streptomyces sp. NPDC090052]|uniref:TetR/AcrR family transcriptional regulator n=1 Tax=unclassified Streptomyces TaxID=2593676 RepID=UPI00225B0E4F|nr:MULTISPECIES: TetR/AcrR family transcriptional regulator [unclassified Streptomyces]MCX4728509.1 TetR family transcriptional regulator [Streptomyces sp. NBC_01306]WSV02287.1 TetR family transcriptional regulator [Streptomyces sp. NBC_01020]WSX40353.1 TetR family transcriptional regulator [Streptomyces sp. NBC_00963]WSX71676.1 TetR family transcriptional regulator [Streptomyces sp. NBC_00932]